ncbi:MAG: ketopantoate reductase family protein [Salinibacterium sp.]|nr:ketopantoate reductase family protein [Salinibacterium sp.]
MRIGVVGAGAVGGALAALLSRAGHEVEVTARGEHLVAIQEHGILLSGAWGDYRAQVDAAEELTRGVELVIIATKAQDAAEAIRANLSVLSGIPIVVVQNGLDSITNAKLASPRSDIIGGLALFASSYLSPGQITVTTGGSLYLGVIAGTSDVPARYATRILAEALPTTTIPNFVGAQWTKLVINHVNALPAITGMSVQEVVANSGLRSIMTSSMRECVRIALTSRVRFEKLQGLSHRGLRLFAVLPLWMGQALPLLMSLRIGRTPNPGSTLQSIRRGQATEIDYLNGAVVRAAERIGMTAPVNQALVELVHEAEARGSFLEPADVVARFS